MEIIRELITRIAADLKNGVKDHTVVRGLNQFLQELQMEHNYINSFIKSAFAIYDLSNDSSLVHLEYHKFGKIPCHDQLSLQLKLSVLKMLSKLIVFYGENRAETAIPPLLLRESMEVMVLVSRLFIDHSRHSQIKPTYHLVEAFHESTFKEQFKVSNQIELVHFLNILQLMRFDVDRGFFDIGKFRINLEAFSQVTSLVQAGQQSIQLVQHIVLEVYLKLLKMGNSQQTKSLKPYLPEKVAGLFSQMISFQDDLLIRQSGMLKISAYYELYLQLKANGKINISDDKIRSFISQDEHFNDARVFDVVALTGYLFPFQIWLEIAVNSKQKNDLTSKAYKCFIWLTDKLCFQPQCSISLVQDYQQRVGQLRNHLKIAQLIILLLLLEKKETQEPILSIIKRILKVLIHCIISLYPQAQEIKEFSEKLLLLCAKFGLPDLQKTVHCIAFYYQTIMGVASEDSYLRFCKNSLIDKNNSVFKTIKVAYEIRNGRTIQPEDRETVKKQPFLALLFQNSLDQSVILDISPETFANTKQKFEIYFILSQNCINCEVLPKSNSNQFNMLQKIVVHFQQTLLFTDYSKLDVKLSLKYICGLCKIYHQLVDIGKDTFSPNLLVHICTILLYLTSLRVFGSKIAAQSMGILLNRYSKIIKILSVVFDEISRQMQAECLDIYKFLCKSMLCWSLENLKRQSAASEKTVVLQAGFSVFYELIHCFCVKHETAPQNIEFLKFMRFQMLSISDLLIESEITEQKSLKLLKLFSSSPYVKKNVKLKILRKLIKEDLVTSSKEITIENLNQLILSTNDANEKKLYAEHLIRNFGEKGKAYLMMKSSANEVAYEFLTSQGKDLDDY